MKTAQWKFQSPIGPIYLVASEKGLQYLGWKKQSVPMQETRILVHAVRELEQYFAGRRKEFSVPLEVSGTQFQMRVWSELAKIPYGQTVSYKEVARKSGAMRAVRAVGTANGRNPICIIVPCHRVIASDGSLGGFSGGLAAKKKLLQLESGGD